MTIGMNSDFLVRMLETGTFRYRTLAQASSLARELALACPNPARSRLGLQELLINAVEHGNLGITYGQKVRLVQENRWQAEIERLAKDPAYSALHVSVHLARTPDGLSLTIQDQGKGFAWQDYMDFSREQAFDLHGRGIAIATASVDAIEYSGNGNTVKVTIFN